MRLRLIIESLLDFTNPYWLYVGKELAAVNIQSPTLCVIPNRSLLTIICDIDHSLQKSALATIEFPVPSNNTDQISSYRIIVYRQSILFTSKKISNNNNPVIYIQPVLINDSSTIKVTFDGQSDKASIGLWYSNQSSWEIKSSICKLDAQNNESYLISSKCILSNNDSLTITYLDHMNSPRNPYFYAKYSQLPIYISSIIGFICFSISIFIYIFLNRVCQMSKSFFHCLINYWFSLGILLPLFAFGIHNSHYKFLCKIIAISLHYLCLTTVLWLTLLTYSIWKKLSPNKDYDGRLTLLINDRLPKIDTKSKSVIQLYIFAYGTALTICIINVAVAHQTKMVKDICLLNDFYSLLILIISIFVFVFLLLFFLLSTHNRIKMLKTRISHSENSTDTSRKTRPSDTAVLSKSNDISSMLMSFNEDTEQIVSNINCQHEIINQLLSILFQLILLIFLFLSSLAIYLHPSYILNFRFEYIIYSHLYGFFVIILSFYILSFYVLLQSDLIGRLYFNYKKIDRSSQNSSIQPSSTYVHRRLNCEYNASSYVEQESIIHSSSSDDSSSFYFSDRRKPIKRATILDDFSRDSQNLSMVASNYCVDCRPVSISNRINSSKNALYDKLPQTSFDMISQESIEEQNYHNNIFDQQELKTYIDDPEEFYTNFTKNFKYSSSSADFSRSLVPSRTSSSQATIRVIPIIHISSQSVDDNLPMSSNTFQSDDYIQLSSNQEHNDTNASNWFCLASSSSSEEYDPTYTYINRTDNLIQQKLLSHEQLSLKTQYSCDSAQLAFIDYDDDSSVSLKSSFHDSKVSSDTLSNNSAHTKTSSSSDFSDDYTSTLTDTNKTILHETSV